MSSKIFVICSSISCHFIGFVVLLPGHSVSWWRFGKHGFFTQTIMEYTSSTSIGALTIGIPVDADTRSRRYDVWSWIGIGSTSSGFGTSIRIGTWSRRVGGTLFGFQGVIGRFLWLRWPLFVCTGSSFLKTYRNWEKNCKVNLSIVVSMKKIFFEKLTPWHRSIPHKKPGQKKKAND